MRERRVRRIRPTLIFGCRATIGRCLSRKLPEFSHKSDLAEHRFGFGRGLGLPMLAQAVPVPELSKLPSLGERKGSASWPLPLLAPAINVPFRPEQKHGPSGEGDILVPFAGRDSDVDDPASGDEFAFTDLDGHGEIAAPAGRVDAGIFAEHRGNTECIPDAVTKPGAVADCHGK